MTPADVCLILEDPHPFIQGETAAWVQELMTSLPDLSFHLLVLASKNQPAEPVFPLPENVVGYTLHRIGSLPEGNAKPKGHGQLFAAIEEPLLKILNRGDFSHIQRLLEQLAPLGDKVGRRFLLDSQQAWLLIQKMYEASNSSRSFIDYFWAWRTLVSGLLSVLLFPLPKARVYHSFSSGYASLALVRANLIEKRPTLLSEHPIYANERRIEVSLANWLYEVRKDDRLTLERIGHSLRRIWENTSYSFSRAGYQAANEIICLYEETQTHLVRDSAALDKLRILPAGVDVLGSNVPLGPTQGLPTIALFGNLVPRRDILTYIRAVALLKDLVPGLRAWIIGTPKADPQYAKVCTSLISSLKLDGTVRLIDPSALGSANSEIHVVVQTSLYDSQGKVLLQAGAAGIPCVATDVGPCRELIMGSYRETPALGSGGEVIGLASPETTANAVYRLIQDETWYQQCSRALRQRVQLYYAKASTTKAYRDLYRHYIEANALPGGGFERWQG